MRIWKKALSAALSAALIASLTASAAFATKAAAATGSDQTDHLACYAAVIATTTTCSQVADGISTVTLTGDPTDDANVGLYISAAGATIITAAGDFVLTGGIVTDAAPVNLASPADSIVLRAPAAPGSAVVSVYEISVTTGIATLEGTLTITFTASSGLDVSAANSVVETRADCDLDVNDAFDGTKDASGFGAPTDTWQAMLCVMVLDGNGNAVVGAVVTGTITPVGLLDGDSYGQSTTLTTDADGVAGFDIYSSGLSGVATIGTSAKIAGKTTTFTPVTFTFTGPLATLTVTQTKFAVAQSVAIGALTTIGTVVGKDAAGNALTCDTTWVAKSGTVGILADANLDVALDTDTDGGGADTADGNCDVLIIGGPTPATLGTTAITVQTADAAIKAAPFNFNVSGATVTVTVTFSAATIVPGGSATVTAEAKDAGSRPVADGTAVVMVYSAGAATPVTTTTNGKATATYLAPFNTGVVTALATIGGINGSGSATVSAPGPLPGACTVASALGANATSGFSTAKKTAGLNKYQTFKISCGAAAAGQTVGIWVATKSGSAYSAYVRVTGRVANASGDAIYNRRSSSAAAIGVRGDLGGQLSTNWVFGVWK